MILSSPRPQISSLRPQKVPSWAGFWPAGCRLPTPGLKHQFLPKWVSDYFIVLTTCLGSCIWSYFPYIIRWKGQSPSQKEGICLLMPTTYKSVKYNNSYIGILIKALKLTCFSDNFQRCLKRLPFVFSMLFHKELYDNSLFGLISEKNWWLYVVLYFEHRNTLLVDTDIIVQWEIVSVGCILTI